MSKSKQLKLIQVFRGIAALLVVLVHGDLIFNQNLNRDFLFDIFAFGGSGVDFFFVLSGFIIFYIHKKDIQNPSRLKSFVLKRLVRIYPIYWVVLTGKLIASFMFDYSSTHQGSFGEIIKAFILFPQDREILSSSFIGVSWTLTFEVFFYILFSFLIWVKPKLLVPSITVWILATLLTFFGFISFPEDQATIQLVFNELNLEFILGCLAAYILSRHKINHGLYLICLGCFLYTISAINTNYGLVSVSDVIAFGIPSTILIIGSVSLELSKNIDVNPLLMILGDASYSIYLIHGFVMNNSTKILVNNLGLKIFLANSITLSIFAIFNAVIAVAVGCIVYFYIEKPIISRLRPLLVKN
ncbi:MULTISPECIES: acyltransferase [unclassified Moorena]|uniref:acyltransferase family protein n=1 Tax=unclassified Moorena TaxID=2683338 RepID=UPI0013BA63A9|nr:MULTISPECIES: acyltransferase [unclassified Moorena]NEP31589.1 acyltransferase [Moorena sp. SIO3B2]NEQ06192.1 acyltransferase [Moorena sp. SIO4E2]NER86152.1 acyltransferase [Moorena sp. SIO3A2]